MLRKSCVSLAAVAALLLTAETASAGVLQNVFQGLRFATTPTGSTVGSAGDGTLVNGARSGRLRIVPANVGDGYTLEVDRTFGVDRNGRSEVYDLGPLELELSGATQSTFGYTTNGLITANAETLASNLNYRAAVKTGGYDGTLTGTLNVANALEINELGFYTLSVDISNSNSQLEIVTLDGSEQQELDFDIGPIDVRGNIYFDLLIGFLNLVGVDASSLSSASPIDQINDAINEAIREQALAAGYQVSTEDDYLVLTPVDGTLGTSLTSNDSDADQSAQIIATVPEPASLALLVLATGLLRRR